MAIMGNEIGKAMLEALGLPKGTVGFTLRVRSGKIVTVECEYCPDVEKGSVVRAMAQYSLVRKAMPEQARAQAEPMHFDAWMRDRTDKAHAAYMAQHSAGGIEYAKRLAGWPPAIPARGPRSEVETSIARLDAHNQE